MADKSAKITPETADITSYSTLKVGEATLEFGRDGITPTAKLGIETTGNKTNFGATATVTPKGFSTSAYALGEGEYAGGKVRFGIAAEFNSTSRNTLDLKVGARYDKEMPELGANTSVYATGIAATGGKSMVEAGACKTVDVPYAGPTEVCGGIQVRENRGAGLTFGIGKAF